MLTAAPLSTIIALARAGALDHAWYQFGAAGYDRQDDDPAALTVIGRLLKDFALRAIGRNWSSFCLQSVECCRHLAAGGRESVRLTPLQMEENDHERYQLQHL